MFCSGFVLRSENKVSKRGSRRNSLQGHTHNEVRQLNRDVSAVRLCHVAEEGTTIMVQRRFRGMAVRMAFEGILRQAQARRNAKRPLDSNVRRLYNYSTV